MLKNKISLNVLAWEFMVQKNIISIIKQMGWYVYSLLLYTYRLLFLHKFSYFSRLYIDTSLAGQMSSWTSFSHTWVWPEVRLSRLLGVVSILHGDLADWKHVPKTENCSSPKPFLCSVAQWGGRMILLLLCLTVFFYISVSSYTLQHQIAVDSFSICALLWTETFL